MAEATSLNAFRKALKGTDSSRASVTTPEHASFARKAVATPMADVYTRPESRQAEQRAIGEKQRQITEFIASLSGTVQKELAAYNEVQDERKGQELLTEYYERRKERGDEGFTEEDNKWFHKSFSSRKLKTRKMIADRLGEDAATAIGVRVADRVRAANLDYTDGKSYLEAFRRFASEESAAYINERPALAGIPSLGLIVDKQLKSLENSYVNNHDQKLSAVAAEEADNAFYRSMDSAFDGPPIGIDPFGTLAEATATENGEVTLNNPDGDYSTSLGSGVSLKNIDTDTGLRFLATSRLYYRNTGDKLELVKGKDGKITIDPEQAAELAVIKDDTGATLLDTFGFTLDEKTGAVSNKKDYTKGGEATQLALNMLQKTPTGVDAQFARLQVFIDGHAKLNKGFPVATKLIEYFVAKGDPELLRKAGEKLTLKDGIPLNKSGAWGREGIDKKIEDLAFERELRADRKFSNRINKNYRALYEHVNSLGGNLTTGSIGAYGSENSRVRFNEENGTDYSILEWKTAWKKFDDQLRNNNEITPAEAYNVFGRVWTEISDPNFNGSPIQVISRYTDNLPFAQANAIRNDILQVWTGAGRVPVLKTIEETLKSSPHYTNTSEAKKGQDLTNLSRFYQGLQSGQIVPPMPDLSSLNEVDRAEARTKWFDETASARERIAKTVEGKRVIDLGRIDQQAIADEYMTLYEQSFKYSTTPNALLSKPTEQAGRGEKRTEKDGKTIIHVPVNK